VRKEPHPRAENSKGEKAKGKPLIEGREKRSNASKRGAVLSRAAFNLHVEDVGEKKPAI